MKLFSILTAAACALVVSACASTPAPTDERVHVMEANEAAEIQPGNICISAEAAKIFTFRDVESEINENGYLAVRVFGKTCELSALKWAFFGDIDYEFAYRFYWLDADGNLVSEQEAFRPRSTTLAIPCGSSDMLRPRSAAATRSSCAWPPRFRPSPTMRNPPTRKPSNPRPPQNPKPPRSPKQPRPKRK